MISYAEDILITFWRSRGAEYVAEVVDGAVPVFFVEGHDAFIEVDVFGVEAEYVSDPFREEDFHCHEVDAPGAEFCEFDGAAQLLFAGDERLAGDDLWTEVAKRGAASYELSCGWVVDPDIAGLKGDDLAGDEMSDIDITFPPALAGYLGEDGHFYECDVFGCKKVGGFECRDIYFPGEAEDISTGTIDIDEIAIPIGHTDIVRAIVHEGQEALVKG